MDIEEVKRQRMRQLQMQQQQQAAMQQVQEQAALQQQLRELEVVVKAHLSRDALSRYGNIKSAHGEMVVQLLVLLGNMVSKNPNLQISDEQLKSILMEINGYKKEINIKRK